MIDAYLAQDTARVSRRFLDGATTRAEWEKRRPRLHREYLDMLGLWPLPEKTPLKAKVTRTRERDGVVIEMLHFQSRPGLYVTGNLYRPKQTRGRLPTVLYVCGHDNRGRDGNKTAFQDHGLWFARNGYVCLIIDTLQLGEIPGVHHGTYRRGRWWWQARGYTPAGVECWNGVRAIDYLVGRPEVDPGRIAVTGISGGGASTFWIAAADERVKCAVPVSGMSDLESYVTHKVINGHCDCMFLVNTYRWEWTTIAALVAPRPLLFANSDKDPIFPMDGNRRISARLRRVYQMYGKPELLDDYVSHGGHAYRPDLRVAVFKWINKHLKNDTGPVKDADFKPLPGKQLRVFPEDKDVPKDAINGKVDETFVPRAEVALPQADRFIEWRKALLKGLREHSLRTFPPRIPAGEREGKQVIDDGQPAVTLSTEPGIKTFLHVVKQAKGRPNTGTLVVYDPKDFAEKERPGGLKVRRNAPFLILHWHQLDRDDDVRVGLFPRGVGQKWTEKSPPNYVERAHALLGRTVDEGRVWDIVAAVKSFPGSDKRKCRWRVAGIGQAGILGAYAALFEPSIEEVVLIDPPKSHREGPTFLNVLRVLDIPEALGLLAPRKLTILTNDRAFDRTVQIYKLAGAGDKIRLK